MSKKRHLALLVIISIISLVGILRVYNFSSSESAEYKLFHEDAYYVMAISKNMADGNGVTYNGRTWTNGIQPLWALLCSIPFLAFGDNTSLYLIATFCVILWVASGIFIYKTIPFLVKTKKDYTSYIPYVFLFLFFIDEDIENYYFHGLETGIYITIMLLTLAFIVRAELSDYPTLGSGRWFKLGIMLGLLMLARNDAVFISSIILLYVLYQGLSYENLKRTIYAGTISSVTVIPWLVYNYILRDSIVPQSGLATRVGNYYNPISFEKVWTGLVKISDLARPSFVPGLGFLPASVNTLLNLGFLAIALSFFYFLVRKNYTRSLRIVTATLGISCIPIFFYYITSSGATWFYPRYFMPMKLLFLLTWTVLVAWALSYLASNLSFVTRFALVATFAVAVFALQVYRFDQEEHTTQYLVPYTKKFSESKYATCENVGAFESGRLGFRLHNEIVNLDGKVNPEALDAITDQNFLSYLKRRPVNIIYMKSVFSRWLNKEYPKWTAYYNQVEDWSTGEVWVRKSSACESRVGATVLKAH